MRAICGAAVVVVALAVAACGGGGAAPPVEPTTTTAAASSGSIACTLLPQATVEQTLHVSVVDMDDESIPTTCSYEPYAGNAAFTLQYLKTAADATALLGYYQRLWGAPTAGPTGLGDSSVVYDESGVTRLIVQGHWGLLEFTLFEKDYPNVPTDHVGVLGQLAQTAIAKLG